MANARPVPQSRLRHTQKCQLKRLNDQNDYLPTGLPAMLVWVPAEWARPMRDVMSLPRIPQKKTSL